MALVKIGAKSRARLRRLSVAYSDDLRLRIVTELFLREMGPSQFYKEFGGGSAPRVNAHFKALAKHGWLRFLRKEPGRGEEHVYRAPELATFDDQIWSLLPYSVRAAYSWRGIKQFAERVREALESGTYAVRSDRRLISMPRLLDQEGWERVVAILDALFDSVLEEQADAKLRVFKSGETPFVATVAQAGFESPSCRPAPTVPIGLCLAEGSDSSFSSTRSFSKLFGDDLQMSIVTQLNKEKMGAAQFHRRCGGASKAAIRRRFRLLEEMGWLKLVDEETGGKRRGAIERLYVATTPALLDDKLDIGLSDSLRSSEGWSAFSRFADQAEDALRRGTFDARLDRHFAWTLLRLDRPGWKRVVSEIDSAIALISKEEENAQTRLAESGEAPIRMVVAFAAFESPQASIRVS